MDIYNAAKKRQILSVNEITDSVYVHVFTVLYILNDKHL